MADQTTKPLALAVGTALAASLASVTPAHADSSPFVMTALSSGYMGGATYGGHGDKGEEKGEEGKCGEGDEKGEEGKCGEGKCGGDKGEEGKCGEGKCGGTV